MIIDSSAIVAILLGEADAGELLDKLGMAETARISALSHLDAGTVLFNRRGPAGKRALDEFLDAAGIAIVSFDQHQAAARPRLPRALRQGSAPGQPQHRRRGQLRAQQGHRGTAALQGR